MMDEYEIGGNAGKERCFGVFSSAGDVPTFGINAWNGREWYDFSKDVMIPRVRSRMEQIRKARISLAHADAYLFPLMPLIRSKVLAREKVKIVDLGGGVGENYIRLESFLGGEYLEYHVVELKGNCKNGRELHLPGNIYFHENDQTGSKCLNEEAVSLLKEADICLVIGTMQYFSSYVDLIKEIADTGVEYIYVARTLISNTANTFYTRQYEVLNGGKYNNIVVGDCAMAVINHRELNTNMYSLGYDICLDLFESDESAYIYNLPKPYNVAEYRDILYQLENLKRYNSEVTFSHDR